MAVTGVVLGGLVLGGCASATAGASGTAGTAAAAPSTVASSATAVTWEVLQEDFALHPETDGLSADQLYATGKQYETGDGQVQWYGMAQAYYTAAQAAGNTDAEAALKRLEDHKAEVLAASPDGQGAIFDFFRAGVTAGQKEDYEAAYAIFHDDAFFFQDPLYRGLGSIADLVRDGNGRAQDINLATELYQYSAETLGKGNGWTSMGLLYEAADGTYPGITHSDDVALAYFLRSYDSSQVKETDFKGPRYAGDLYEAGYVHDDSTKAAPDPAAALAAYLVAANGNGRTFDGTSAYKLAVLYDKGSDGVEQNDAEALKYYEKAISDPNVHATMLGIPQTYLALGEFYEKGRGTTVDLATAKKYYKQALDAADENLALKEAAGSKDAQAVHDEATAALKRLAAGTGQKNG
ncbi:MAG: hypothetical protein QM779_01780 [Propionicimonas sp.]|uniref:tetratricopeptide repeat protein n=1 Tax=Propionicimonas sp. TaxID=1955623 RepID=UPI003D10B921